MLFQRMWRAARFDAALYEELRRDPVAISQAIATVLLAILATVAGATLGSLVNGGSPVERVLIALVLFMPGMWLLPAVSLFFLGGLARATNPDRGSNRDLIIAIGYSAAPGTFLLLLSFPRPMDLIAGPLAMAWVLAAMVGAARGMLGVSLMRATMFVAPGLLLFLLVALR